MKPSSPTRKKYTASPSKLVMPVSTSTGSPLLNMPAMLSPKPMTTRKLAAPEWLRTFLASHTSDTDKPLMMPGWPCKIVVSCAENCGI